MILAQITLNWEAGLIIYGPLGIGWVGMAYYISRLTALHKEREDKLLEIARERDQKFQEIMDKQADAYKSMAHKISGVSKGMVFIAATYGDAALKALAQAELAKMTDK
jgi:hypothetical protein